MEEFEADRARLVQELAHVNSMVTELRAALLKETAHAVEIQNARNVEAERYKSEIEKASREAFEARQALRARETQIELLESSRDTALDRIKTLEDRAAGALAEAINSENFAVAEIGRLTRELDAARLALSRTRAEATDQVNKTQELCNKAVSSVLAAAEAKDQKLQSLAVELARDKQVLSAGELELDSIRAELKYRTQQVDDLRSQLERANAENEDLTAKIQRLKGDLV